ESAHRGATARSVHRDKRIQQERNVVIRDIEVPLVGPGNPRKRVEIFDGWSFRIVDNNAVFAETCARNFFQWLTIRVIDNLVIELAANNEIDGVAGVESFF